LGLNCFTISLDIPNPSKGGPWIATPTSTKKSFELIGNPFGQINYSNLPKLVDSSLWRLPADVLTEIRKLAGGVDFLSVCKSMHKAFFPAFKFLDYHGTRTPLPGFYTFTKHQTVSSSISPCYTFAYELNADGTFTGIKRENLPYTGSICTSKLISGGVWTLDRRVGGTAPHCVKSPFVIHLSDKQGIPPKTIPLEEHKKVDVTREVWDQKYMNPQDSSITELQPNRSSHSKKTRCGIPLEEQIADQDCCHEVIQDIMESVWNENFEPLGCQVKQDIISRVSRLCMNPPGMTDGEIKIALAQEIANCDQWNEAFQGIVN